MNKVIDMKSKEALDAILAKRDVERTINDYKMENETLK
jgi:hypothetical protein